MQRVEFLQQKGSCPPGHQCELEDDYAARLKAAGVVRFIVKAKPRARGAGAARRTKRKEG